MGRLQGAHTAGSVAHVRRSSSCGFSQSKALKTVQRKCAYLCFYPRNCQQNLRVTATGQLRGGYGELQGCGGLAWISGHVSMALGHLLGCRGWKGGCFLEARTLHLGSGRCDLKTGSEKGQGCWSVGWGAWAWTPGLERARGEQNPSRAWKSGNAPGCGERALWPLAVSSFLRETHSHYLWGKLGAHSFLA